jgi:hypothetical protein
MTLKQTVLDYFESNGMSEQQSAAVFDALRTDPNQSSMLTRWNDPTSDYPPVMVQIVTLAARFHAARWIEDNCPEAWFRTVFD